MSEEEISRLPEVVQGLSIPISMEVGKRLVRVDKVEAEFYHHYVEKHDDPACELLPVGLVADLVTKEGHGLLPNATTKPYLIVFALRQVEKCKEAEARYREVEEEARKTGLIFWTDDKYRNCVGIESVDRSIGLSDTADGELSEYRNRVPHNRGTMCWVSKEILVAQLGRAMETLKRH